jgi:hypothetical protein
MHATSIVSIYVSKDILIEVFALPKSSKHLIIIQQNPFALQSSSFLILLLNSHLTYLINKKKKIDK